MEHTDMDHGKMDMADMAGMDMKPGSNMMNHGGHMMNMGNMRRKFWVSLILMVPLLVVSPVGGFVLIPNLPGAGIYQIILGSVIFFYCGTPFFSGARGEFASRKPAMMMLITMAITVAYAYSVYATIVDFVHPGSVMNFWFELSTLIVIMLIGHLIEMNAIMRAGDALNSLASLVPKKAHRLTADGGNEDVAISELAVGDKLLVKENERIPADGAVAEGVTEALVDESMITGESRAVTKSAGAEVFGGALNQNVPFEMTVASVGADSFLSQVAKMVSDAQNRKSDRENLADRVAGWLFWIAGIAGLIALVVWWIATATVSVAHIGATPMSVSNALATALSIAVAVFVIACPHALGLAVPLVVSRLTNLSAKNGLLIQNRTSLEGIGKIKFALMDKTGTLTDGKFIVRETVAFDESMDVLGVVAALEGSSTHPIAQSIVAAAKAANKPTLAVEDVENLPGVGITGLVEGRKYSVVSAKYLRENGVKFDEGRVEEFLDLGLTVSFLIGIDKEVLGFIALGDSPKDDARSFIKGLLDQGITPVMLTGDNKATAEKVSKTLGIPEYRAELRPEDKADIVKEYQKQGGVLFIGDGVNDSPALATSELGIAIGSGTSVAINTADVVLVNSNPSDVLDLITIAKRSNRKMTQNLWWGAGYNLITIPIAAGILIPSIGLRIDPLAAAIIMSLSTIVVSVNAMGLRYNKK